jgi:hypothetical protein
MDGVAASVVVAGLGAGLVLAASVRPVQPMAGGVIVIHAQS